MSAACPLARPAGRGWLCPVGIVLSPARAQREGSDPQTGGDGPGREVTQCLTAVTGAAGAAFPSWKRARLSALRRAVPSGARGGSRAPASSCKQLQWRDRLAGRGPARPARVPGGCSCPGPSPGKGRGSGRGWGSPGGFLVEREGGGRGQAWCLCQGRDHLACAVGSEKRRRL